jgi:hypothetical protein
LLDFPTVDQGPVPRSQIPHVPSIVKEYLGMPAAGAIVRHGNLVRGSPTDDERATRFQAKNVGPSRSLPNNEVSGTIVLLHREWLEITLENVRAVAACPERETVPDFSSSYGGKSKADDPQ